MSVHPGTLSTGSLQDDIAALFAPAVSVALTDPAAEHDAPFAEEETTLARANDKRRREFRAGRTAAREAMQEMGLPPLAIPADETRAPVWPEPVTGSITHNETLCIAVIAERRNVPGIGVDIEEATPLDPELFPDICTLPERAWLSLQTEETRGMLAKLIFSAKECAYKCQFPLSRTFLEFHDLEITADLETGQFEATYLRSVPGFERGARLYGRYMVTRGQIITAITAEQHPTRAAQRRRVSWW
ncbi:MAG: 4'-phosphopantetheinyl transferase superfamily protein [Roseovarius sp.]|uniref:4'-phosphopantetheinyl transferase family protein n=1 Tax=Roseovarius sp. TaxID=1486281 RepID=UPI0032F032FF